MENSVLDSANYQAPKVSPWPIAVKFGLLGALAAIAITMTSYFTGGMDPSAQMENGFNAGTIFKSMGIVVIGYVIYTMIYFLAIKKYREELGGFISFGKGFKVAFFSALIKAIIVTLFLFIFYKFIAADFLPNLISTMEEMMSEAGQSEEQLEMTMKVYNVMYTPFAMAIMTGMTTVVGGAILSVIAAAIGQKEPSL